MKRKKILAFVTSIVCACGAFTALPFADMGTYAEEAVYNDFEVNYDGWHGSNGFSELTAGYFGGSGRGMLVTDRQSAQAGAESSKGFYLEGGREYDYSVMVKADKDEVFRLSLLVKDDKTDEETVEELVSEKVSAGEWTKLSASYTAPEGSYEFKFTLTTDSTNDFYFDEFKATDQRPVGEVSAASTEKGLKDEFAGYFKVGNILNSGTVKDSKITARMLKDHNAIECENETKPDATLAWNGQGCTNTDIKVRSDGFAAIADFCIKNNIAFRGHTMVWHSQTPEWFFKDNFQNSGNWVSSSVMDQRLESYIKNMFNLYKTQYPQLNLYAYDVCNECISDDQGRCQNNGGARRPGYGAASNGEGLSPWVQVYGSNVFMDKAFTFAKKYRPSGCKLFYNDYNEYMGWKMDKIYEKCKDLYSRGLLDGVGMQSHVPANATGFAGTVDYLAAMKKYLSIGCEVQVTELDISVNNGEYSYTDQATKYKAIFQAAMDWNKTAKEGNKVSLVQVWGPDDGHSWLSAGSNALLYDASGNPKEAYKTLTAMIPQSQWGTSSSEPVVVEPNEYGWYFDSGFEDGTGDWVGRGAAKVEQSSYTHYTKWGNNSLYVSGRTAAWNGAELPLDTNAFQAGKTYSFSAHVTYSEGDETDKFFMKLQYKDADGKTQYSTIDEGTGVKDKWLQLVNTEYTIPADATDMRLYIETAESTNSFYVDEVIGAVGGTGISGEGDPELPAGYEPEHIIGDINGDNKLNVFDLLLAKRGLINGFKSDAAAAAADVDQSGTFDKNDVKAIMDYLCGRISKFPEVERTVDLEKGNSVFSGVTPLESYKKDGNNNVLWTQRFGADPGFMVYKDRLYVFTTNDAIEYNSAGKIQVNTYNSGTINCFSSSDLVNWTDHGAIPAAGRNGRTTGGAASWASFAWAPDACWKTINGKDKFFLYFADSAGGIGVLTADSPLGPWKDPLGHALINKSTPGFNVEWLFDPAVLVDDDGTGYLYCGGGVPAGQDSHPKTARVVKLGADMISLSGSPATIDAPYLFEDSSIMKDGNTYYYSYCTNWNTGGNPYGFQNAEIAVMTSSSPMGPFTYSNIVLKNPASYQLDGGGNNHHSIVKFKNKYYVLYHSRNLSRAMNIQAVDKDGKIDLGGNYRSTHIDAANLSGGKFTATGTMKGVSQLETLNPYNKTEAETMSNQSPGISVSGVGNTTVSGGKGSWIKVSGASFTKGAKSFTLRASSKNGAMVKICTGSAKGAAIGYVDVPSGGSMKDITVGTENITGTKDIYLVFSGDVQLDNWQFKS